MRKLLRAARKRLIPICFFLIAVMLGWRFFPNYLVLPNLFDYGVSYWLSSDQSGYGVLADLAEKRIGERGAVVFIKAGLESGKPDKVARTFVAVRELNKAHGDAEENREVFFAVASFLSRDISSAFSFYDGHMVREQAYRYLFAQGNRPWFDEACRERVIGVFVRSLSDSEQRIAAKYLADKEWFVEAATAAGLGWALDDSDLCETCGDEVEVEVEDGE